MTDPVVSILVVTWKRIDLLEECLKGIAAAKPAVPFEIVVVNNGGAKTAARVEAVAAGARVVHSRVNLGLPGGLRLARSVARGTLPPRGLVGDPCDLHIGGNRQCAK